MFGIFKKFKKKKTAQPQSNWNDALNLDRFWMLQEMEFQRLNKEHQFRASESNPLKMGTIVHSLFDIRKEEVALLTVNDGSALTNIENQDDIWDYNFLSLIIRQIEGSHQFNVNDHTVIMSLYYRGYAQKDSDKDKSISKKNGCLLIHLVNASGVREKVIYVQATFCHPPINPERFKQGMLPQAKNISFLIGYDYRPENEITEEFHNVFNSAKNKIHNERKDELTLLECDLLNLLTHPQIASDYYRGRQTMRENRFWDAIAYLESAFRGLKSHWWNNDAKLNDEEWNMLMEISFHIGFCYYELGLYERAYMYLELPYDADPTNYNYFTEYVNCLEQLQDAREWTIVNRCLQELQEGQVQEKDIPLLLFCFRRMAYMLIELGQYEDARKYLKEILKIDPDNEFAKNELKYILSFDEFVPDTTYPKVLFPWSDVMDCLSEKLDNNNFKEKHSCPKCGLRSQQLIWIQFKSPQWTWEKLCGRKGPLSICPKCRIQVQFICFIMN
jgi:tetratricopeptide (TPR) repeat protein